ncbi:uncharacterized protein LOC115622230 [Scaptodrosophila lebanonensis]|uniref:Uncharacterized protein LOC115622230 n=1 Tax=Drosophila lebanonensis TaxID=7225 RepID=A0A6J2TAK1_DROLE|nr:uncharacterized protein LOC115622230 [Scaptodrosophila lebanonensis]
MRLLALSACLCLTAAANWTNFMPRSPLEDYRDSLRLLLQKLLWTAHVKSCFAIITDDLHFAIYERSLFEAASRHPLPYYMVQLEDSEDLLQPPDGIESVLRAIKAYDCDLHVMTFLNGGQLKRLLRFVYDSRSLNTHRKFILLYDERLFDEDMLHIWSALVDSVFLQRNTDNSFSLSTIAYPGILSGFLVIKQLGNWETGRSIDSKRLFKNKRDNLNGAQLPVAIMEHVPMVQLVAATSSYQGVEIEIMTALAKALNFQPMYYQLNETDFTDSAENGTRAIVIGEVANHNARFAIGDLHLFLTYLDYIELSYPHNFECLTFLTPESSTDTSWETFTLPFSAEMWAGVMLSLFVVGTIFYIISYLHSSIMDPEESTKAATTFFGCLRKRRKSFFDERQFRSVSFRIALTRRRSKLVMPRDIFDNYASCILLTYSMLLYVSLPRMPYNWPLRVLTGWYWLYCLLLVAIYRASFTAILANPVARVTIDTLQDLVNARIPPTTGAAENKNFFLNSSDEIAQKLGDKMEIVELSADLTARIERGQCAYYDNEYFLRYMRVGDEERGVGFTALHIMRECVVYMPVVLGMEKNSALKPHVDNYIMRLSEGGLISKWLRDSINRLPAEEEAPQEALMNLHKFWSSFGALAIGYFLACCAIFAERWHFKKVVMKHPMYDAYNPSLYYNFKRRYPDL